MVILTLFIILDLITLSNIPFQDVEETFCFLLVFGNKIKVIVGSRVVLNFTTQLKLLLIKE